MQRETLYNNDEELSLFAFRVPEEMSQTDLKK